MSYEFEGDKLVELFRRLGAPDPEGWARSQLQEGIPQLARFAFLKDAWDRVVPEGDSSWIEREVEGAERNPEAPFSGIGLAIQRLRSLGATDHDLTDLVRGMQVSMLFSLLYLLDDPGEVAEEAGLGWALFELAEDDRIISVIPALHESLLSLDPTGREMRPRDAAK